MRFGLVSGVQGILSNYNVDGDREDDWFSFWFLKGNLLLFGANSETEGVPNVPQIAASEEK